MSAEAPAALERQGEQELEVLLEMLKRHMPGTDLGLIRRAYAFAEEVHRGEMRLSGSPYIRHCLEVAMILAQQGIDATTIAAGFLHDVLETGDKTREEQQQVGTGARHVTYGDVERAFGPEIARIVDGVSRIGELKLLSQEAQQAEYFRKMLIFMTDDIRVILVKFADRLHNMRALEFLPPAKRRRIALETRDVYAPLAHRLGMARVKWELDDLQLKFLETEAYRELVRNIHTKREEREAYIESIRKPLAARLAAEGIAATIEGRPKSFYSIYGKMQSRGRTFEQIYDLLAIRVLVNTKDMCYQVMGIVHDMQTPVSERFKDFIARPKSNGYQSLHTTVIGPGGRAVEIQIRSNMMHRVAEEGIAAHWLYKEGRDRPDKLDRTMGYLRELADSQRETPEPEKFLEELKGDLFADEVFVFTPRGDLKRLPQGATALDFAFSVHTDVGLHCLGAKVNDKMVRLDTPLASSDTVEILTMPTRVPSADWLGIVKTAKARSVIKRWLRQAMYSQSVALGRKLLEGELRRVRLHPSEGDLADMAQALGLGSTEQLYAHIGSGELSLGRVLAKLTPHEPHHTHAPRDQDAVIRVQGMANMMVRVAQCCQPLPGDDIVGFITRGRGVAVHRTDCPNVAELLADRDRLVEVTWDSPRGQVFAVRILVSGDDRPGLLRDISTTISDLGANILDVEAKTERRRIRDRFVVEVKNRGQLARLMAQVQELPGVTGVERLDEPEGERSVRGDGGTGPGAHLA